MLAKFEINAAMCSMNLVQVTESIFGSVVPLAMFNPLYIYVVLPGALMVMWSRLFFMIRPMKQNEKGPTLKRSVKFPEVTDFQSLFGSILRICVVYSLVRLTGDNSLRFGSESRFWMTPAMIHTIQCWWKDPYLMWATKLFKQKIWKQVFFHTAFDIFSNENNC